MITVLLLVNASISRNPRPYFLVDVMLYMPKSSVIFWESPAPPWWAIIWAFPYLSESLKQKPLLSSWIECQKNYKDEIMLCSLRQVGKSSSSRLFKPFRLILSCIAFPKSFCSKMDALISKFWRGGRDHSKIYWKSWEVVSSPKWARGTGLRNFQAFNLALLAKQCWRLLNSPNSLCAEVLKHRYFPNSNLLEATKGSRPSRIWSSLLRGLQILKSGVRLQVNNGKSIDVWRDAWVPDLPNFRLLCTSEFN